MIISLKDALYAKGCTYIGKGWKVGKKIEKRCDYCGATLVRETSQFRGDRCFCNNTCKQSYHSICNGSVPLWVWT